MFSTSTRWFVTLGLIVAIVVGPAVESQACFGLFRRWCERYYSQSPAVVAQPACAPQVVNYVPQTCYRTQYCSVPVTTYRPQTAFDPCTNCPVSCMRPVTTYVTQARMVPYTTYRLQYSNPCNTCAAPATTTYYAPQTVAPAATTTYMPTTVPTTTYAAPAIPTTSYSQPAVYNQPVATPGCSNCAAGGANYAATPAAPGYAAAYPSTITQPSIVAPSTTTPTYTTPSYAPSYSSSVPSPTSGYTTPSTPNVGAPTTQPSLNTTPATTPGPVNTYAPTTPAPATTPGPIQSTGPAKTYENGATGTTTGAPAGGMAPIADPMKTQAAPMSGPGLLDPRARTTSMPVYRPGSYSEVNWPTAPASTQPYATLTPVTLPIETSAPVQPAVQPQPAPANEWRPSRR